MQAVLLLGDSACSQAAGEGGVGHAGLWSSLSAGLQVGPDAQPEKARRWNRVNYCLGNCRAVCFQESLKKHVKHAVLCLDSG